MVVIHENRGLNPYIEDVARRLAVANFLAFAPDALTPLGGYPGDEEKAAQLFGQLDPAKRTEDLVAAYGVLKSRPECSGKVGAIGFCFGGTTVNAFAVRFATWRRRTVLRRQPAAADVAKIKAPMMLHYAGLDERINAGWPAYEGAQGQWREVPGLRLSEHQPRLPQRHDAALRRRRPSSRGRARWRSSTRT